MHLLKCDRDTAQKCQLFPLCGSEAAASVTCITLGTCSLCKLSSGGQWSESKMLLIGGVILRLMQHRHTAEDSPSAGRTYRERRNRSEVKRPCVCGQTMLGTQRKSFPLCRALGFPSTEESDGNTHVRR
jgi:hypothetical protein